MKLVSIVKNITFKRNKRKKYRRILFNCIVCFLETEDGFTLVNAKLPVNVTLNTNEPEILPEFSDVSGKSTTVILKDLRTILGKDQFRQLLYSSLTGVQILVRGPNIQRLESLYGLSSLIPRACRRVKTQATEYMDPNKCNFIGIYIHLYILCICTIRKC